MKGNDLFKYEPPPRRPRRNTGSARSAVCEGKRHAAGMLEGGDAAKFPAEPGNCA